MTKQIFPFALFIALTFSTLKVIALPYSPIRIPADQEFNTSTISGWDGTICTFGSNSFSVMDNELYLQWMGQRVLANQQAPSYHSLQEINFNNGDSICSIINISVAGKVWIENVNNDVYYW